METLEHEIDELDAYKGKWVALYILKYGKRLGDNRYNTREEAQEAIDVLVWGAIEQDKSDGFAGSDFVCFEPPIASKDIVDVFPYPVGDS